MTVYHTKNVVKDKRNRSPKRINGRSISAIRASDGRDWLNKSHIAETATVVRINDRRRISNPTIVESDAPICLSRRATLKSDPIFRATANRVALEACIQARNEGRSLAREGNDVIREACRWSPELAAACELWKEIKFEFDAVDTL